MTNHHGRRVARPLATGVMGPTTTTTRRITIPTKIGPSIPFAGAATEAKPSPYAKLQQANAELQIELHEVKRRAADGDLFDLKNHSLETRHDYRKGRHRQSGEDRPCDLEQS